jgi:hypothetical protein
MNEKISIHNNNGSITKGLLGKNKYKTMYSKKHSF